jgi:hypothetical protein
VGSPILWSKYQYILRKDRTGYVIPIHEEEEEEDNDDDDDERNRNIGVLGRTNILLPYDS